jgi:hypothetical protein
MPRKPIPCPGNGTRRLGEQVGHGD